MAGAGCVILPAALDARGQLISPSPAFEDAAAGVGLAHVETTAVDHVARWFQPALRGVPSLALAAAAQFQGWDLNRLLTARTPAALGRRLGQSLDAEGRLLINFVGPPNSLRALAAHLLAGRLAPETVRGKLVLVGGVWSGVQDVQFVPFAGWGAALDQSAMTGVESQANCVATLLTRPPLRQASFPANALLVLATVLAASMITVEFAHGALSLGLGALRLAAGFSLFAREQLFVRLAPPLAGIAAAYLAAALITERRAHHLRRHFRRYVGRLLADRIAEMSDAEIGRMGTERVVTLLFSDIRGYTRFSSTRAPAAIVAFLNRYFEQMTAAALAHNGFVDKYIGDGLMAVFGIFTPDERGAEGAREAVRAALAMRQALDESAKSTRSFRRSPSASACTPARSSSAISARPSERTSPRSAARSTSPPASRGKPRRCSRSTTSAASGPRPSF